MCSRTACTAWAVPRLSAGWAGGVKEEPSSRKLARLKLSNRCSVSKCVMSAQLPPCAVLCEVRLTMEEMFEIADIQYSSAHLTHLFHSFVFKHIFYNYVRWNNGGINVQRRQNSRIDI
jgi:hypothetical protein